MPLGPLRELEGDHLDDSVLFGSIGYVYAFVYGKTCNLAEVVVGMGADGADSVWAEGKRFGLPSVNLAEFLFAEHNGLLIVQI